MCFNYQITFGSPFLVCFPDLRFNSNDFSNKKVSFNGIVYGVDFIGNMSKRAAEMLVEDLETRGPVKLSEVEVAQKEVLSIVRRMSEAGEIILGGGGGGGEEYV